MKQAAVLGLSAADEKLKRCRPGYATMVRVPGMDDNHLQRRLEAIEAVLLPEVQLRAAESRWHGLAHLREVSLLAGRIAQAEGGDESMVEAAMVGGWLHDIGREGDEGGNAHAIAAAELAGPLLAEHYPHLPGAMIVDAIRRHADGDVTTNPLAAALWDADRLTIGRAGITPRIEYFSTRTGRRLAGFEADTQAAE